MNAVQVQPPATGPYEYLLPVVSRTEGSGGSQWLTDVYLGNPFQQTLQVEVLAYAAGVDVSDEQAIGGSYSLASYTSMTIENLHADLGLADGNYSVLVRCALPLTVAARFFNDQQGTELSQFMNAIPVWEELLPGDKIRFVLPKEEDISRVAGYRSNTFMRLSCAEHDLFGSLLPPKVNATLYSRQGVRRAEVEVRIGSSNSPLPNGGLTQISNPVESHFGFSERPGDTLVYTITRGHGVIITSGVQNNGGLDDGWVDRGIVQRLLTATLTIAPQHPVVGEIAILAFSGTADPGYEITSASAGLDQLLPYAGDGTNVLSLVAHLPLNETGTHTPAAVAYVTDPNGVSWSRTFLAPQIEVTEGEPYTYPATDGNQIIAANLDEASYYAGFGLSGDACFTEAAARQTFRTYTDGSTSNGEVRGGWLIDISERELQLLDVDGHGANRVISRLPWDSIRYFTTLLPQPD